jgi:hypothetical protein
MSFDFEKFANIIENGLKQTHEMSHNKIFIFNPSVNEYFISANNMRQNSKTKNITYRRIYAAKLCVNAYLAIENNFFLKM